MGRACSTNGEEEEYEFDGKTRRKKKTQKT
jgi:hypothetical protein